MGEDENTPMDESMTPAEEPVPAPEPFEAPPAAAAPPPPPPPPPPAAPPVAAPALAGDKNRTVAAILGILLGWVGAHKFYLGYTTEGIIMVVVGVFTGGSISWIIGIIEGIMYLTKTDEEFYNTYVANKKAWF